MKSFILFLFSFITIAVQAQDLTPFKDENGKYGYKDSKGKIIITANYDYAKTFSEGLACVGKGDVTYRKYGFIDITGKLVIPYRYDDADFFSEGLAAINIGLTMVGDESWAEVENGGKWGYIDKTGKEIIAPKYDLAKSFSYGFAEVNNGGKFFSGFVGGEWGIIDKTGKEIISVKYDEADFKKGTAELEKGMLEYNDKNHSSAIKWWQKAEKKGNAVAMSNLGYLYENGIGITKDIKKAFDYYKKAADKGDAQGMYNLGAMYYKGIGVTKNEATAKEWIQKAANKGHEGAKDALKQM